MTAPIRIAVIGLGKIARDRHLPAIAGDAAFELVATVDPNAAAADGVPGFADLDALAASGIAVDAVAVCTPPQVRGAVARAAIAHGWHVMLEKPPAATVREAEALRDAAAAAGTVLFASWHTRFARGAAPARDWLADKRIRRVEIVWREDVRVWHPGQRWLWQPGGFGVFDPGINAISLLTMILPGPVFVTGAELDVPANLAAPIEARVRFTDATATPMTMDLSFLQQGEQSWNLTVETDAGVLALSRGGAGLVIGGTAIALGDAPREAEYPAMYAHFAGRIRAGTSDMDLRPIQLVADAFLCGRPQFVEEFVE